MVYILTVISYSDGRANEEEQILEPLEMITILWEIYK